MIGAIVIGARLIALTSEALALLCLACLAALALGGTLYWLDKWRVK